MSTKKSKSSKLVNMNLPVDILEKCNNKAKELGITRTSFIIMAINEYLKQQDTLSQLPIFIEELKKIQNQDNKSK